MIESQGSPSPISPVAVVLGAGPGLGAAVAARFARSGFDLALMSRKRETALQACDRVLAAGRAARVVTADATDPASIAAAFAEVRRDMGDPEVYVYNAGAFQPGGVIDVSPEMFESCWRANCFGGFLGAREVLPAMIARARGTVIFTGATASVRGSAGFSCLAVGKFGLRALAQSMARELGPKGIHVAHVIIDGQIDTPGLRARSPDRPVHTLLSPDAIAEAYWHLHSQDPTAWAHEIDLRPSAEKF